MNLTTPIHNMKSNQSKSVAVSIPPLLQLKWSLEQLSLKLLSHTLSERSVQSKGIQRQPLRKTKNSTGILKLKQRFQSFPNRNTIKRIRLVLKSEASEHASSSLDSALSRYNAVTMNQCSMSPPTATPLKTTTRRIQKLKLKCTPKATPDENQTMDKISYKMNAHDMVKWAMKNNILLSQHYQVTGILGWGGCGTVLSGIRRIDKKKVAIKLIYKQKTSGSTKPIEMDVLSRLNHGNIVSYECEFEDDRAYYLVMEQFGCSWRHSDASQVLVVDLPDSLQESKTDLLSVQDGSCSSLFDYIDEFKRVPCHILRDVLKQLSSALYYIHSLGIVHGDIKEENVLIGIDSSGTYCVKWIDFGHARITKRNHPDMKFYGTRDLSAPELLENLKVSDVNKEPMDVFYGYEQDIWAFGLLLYTMIHGTLPRENDSIISNELSLTGHFIYPTTYSSNIEPGCIYLLKRMLCINPKSRISCLNILQDSWIQRK